MHRPLHQNPFWWQKMAQAHRTHQHLQGENERICSVAFAICGDRALNLHWKVTVSTSSASITQQKTIIRLHKLQGPLAQQSRHKRFRGGLR